MVINKLPKPIPAGGVDLYNNEISKCLSLCDKKDKNYKIYKERIPPVSG